MLHPGLWDSVVACTLSTKLSWSSTSQNSLHCTGPDQGWLQEKLVHNLERDRKQPQQMLLLEDGCRIQVPPQLHPSPSLICQMAASVWGKLVHQLLLLMRDPHLCDPGVNAPASVKDTCRFLFVLVGADVSWLVPIHPCCPLLGVQLVFSACTG